MNGENKPAQAGTPSARAVKADDVAIVRRILRDYLPGHVGTLALGIACMLVASASTGALAWLVQPAIDLIFVDKRTAMLVAIPVAIIVVVIVRSVSSFGEQALINGLAEKIIAATQRDMFHSQVKLDLTSSNAIHSGEAVSKFLYDAVLLRNSLVRGAGALGRELVTLVFLVAVMVYRDWKLSLMSVIVLPAVAWVTQQLGKSIRKSTNRGMEETGNLSTTLTEALTGRRIIKAYGLEDYAAASADMRIDLRLKYLLRSVRARAAAVPSTDLFGGLVIAATIFYAGYQGLHGSLSLGAFSSFLAAMLLAQQPVRNLSQLWTVAVEGLSAAQRIFATIDTKPEIVDRPGATPLHMEPAPKGGAIAFDQVAFTYQGDTKLPALDRASFAAAAGQKIALVGPSGAGKSTVFNLLLRFYDIDSGAITIDGKDIRDVTLKSLREHIALVTQEPILFDESVADNIALGRRDASRAEIKEAAKAAAADGFIRELPQGYDTRVGEGGLKLSGGQRQRIAIARAMLRNAPILLLDEATSALDTESERIVQEALGRLMKGRTTLVIAHRLSTVLDADCIYVLDRGRILESGTHGALMAQKGLYARLYSHGSLDEPVGVQPASLATD